ncbi:MAG: hypothetical protein AAFX50_19940 [Acidobacteriota bacterium]
MAIHAAPEPAPTRVDLRSAPSSSRGDADSRGVQAPESTPRAARHRLAEISLAPVQRCGCTKHYEKPGA